MAFASLLEHVGGMGRFQVLSVLLLSLPVLMMASHNLLQNFTAAGSEHRCRPRPEANATGLDAEALLRVWVPRGERCRRFVAPQWWLLEANGSAPNGSSGPETEPCGDGWIYDRSVFTSTIITEVGPSAGAVALHGRSPGGRRLRGVRPPLGAHLVLPADGRHGHLLVLRAHLLHVLPVPLPDGHGLLGHRPQRDGVDADTHAGAGGDLHGLLLHGGAVPAGRRRLRHPRLAPPAARGVPALLRLLPLLLVRRRKGQGGRKGGRDGGMDGWMEQCGVHGQLGKRKGGSKAG
uniref:Uncharacterized protein n=1 Tax=Catharus ustulatus TaxID=91951 RepID=A0A8C3UAA9_CATUS